LRHIGTLQWTDCYGRRSILFSGFSVVDESSSTAYPKTPEHLVHPYNHGNGQFYGGAAAMIANPPGHEPLKLLGAGV